jgi:hypothetical protein
MGPPTTSTNYRTDSAGYGSGETQENMFDEPSAIAVPEEHETSYEAEYEAHAETAYEPAEEFSEDVPELISYQAGTGHAGIEPSHAPATEPVGEVIGEPAAASEPANSEQSNSEPAKLEAQSETVIVAPAEETPADPATEPAQPTMLTANDFTALEERVLRAVALVRSERQARIAAEERATALETQLHSLEAQIQQIEAQSPILERLVQEVESLRIEREQVRQRVERLLGQLDALEL